MATAALGGANHWTSSGPGFATVMQIAVDPGGSTVAYAVVRGVGVFKTSNGGQTWRAVNDGFPGATVSTLLVLPDAPDTLLAASNYETYVSVDGGEHWSRAGDVASLRVLTLAYDPSSRVLYAGTGSDLYRSTDMASTWLPTHGRSGSVSTIALASDGTVYALATAGQSSLSGLLVRSTDRGENWAPVAGAPYIEALAIDPETGAIYVVADIIGQQLWSSTDGAKSWNTLAPPPKNITLSSLVATGGGKIYATTNQGVYVYDIGTRAWSRAGESLPTLVRSVAVSSTQPRRFYAAGYTGITTGVGDDPQWSASNQGLPGAIANDVAVSRDGTIAYAASVDGLFKTGDDGQTWQSQATEAAFQAEISPVDPNTAYAASNDGTKKTTDGGATW
ncbi:MAG TPA: DUF1668 domain-containing protein, partial [Thermoanaerobaculia bacterium]